jgi:hypothetical protein
MCRAGTLIIFCVDPIALITLRLLRPPREPFFSPRHGSQTQKGKGGGEAVVLLLRSRVQCEHQMHHAI